MAKLEPGWYWADFPNASLEEDRKDQLIKLFMGSQGDLIFASGPYQHFAKTAANLRRLDPQPVPPPPPFVPGYYWVDYWGEKVWRPTYVSSRCNNGYIAGDAWYAYNEVGDRVEVPEKYRS